MRIAILGATGQTGETWVSILPIEDMLEKKYSSTFFVSGLQAVLQALDSGHSVTALVKEYFSPVHPPCTISYLPHHSGAQSRQAGPYH